MFAGLAKEYFKKMKFFFSAVRFLVIGLRMFHNEDSSKERYFLSNNVCPIDCKLTSEKINLHHF